VIPGICGQIGSALAKKLNDDWMVIGFDLHHPDAECRIDALDADAVRSFLIRQRNVVAVVNCLGDSNTADSLSFASILDVRKDDFVSMLNNNLVSAFIVMQEYIRVFGKAQGNIINIASLYSTVSPNPKIYDGTIKHPGYVASKFGLVGLTKYMAVLAAEYNIKINCVSPGAVLGTKGVSDEFLKKYNSLVPMEDGVEIDDVYQVVDMLCKNKKITGQNIVIDGGYGLW